MMGKVEAQLPVTARVQEVSWEGRGHGMERKEGYTMCHGRKTDRTWWTVCARACMRTLGKGECEESRLLAFSSG